jgi:hypothetical protein
MRLHQTIALVVAAGLLLAACVPLPTPVSPGPATPTSAQPTSEPAETPMPAATAAQAALAARLGVAAGQIAIVSVERVEWPDVCLGATGEGELCAQVLTPGYRIVLEAESGQYEVHTDERGQAVRVVTP